MANVIYLKVKNFFPSNIDSKLKDPFVWEEVGEG